MISSLDTNISIAELGLKGQKSYAARGFTPYLVFSADLTTSTTAEVGASPTATFVRASSKTYSSESGNVATVTSGNPAVPGTVFTATTGLAKGIVLAQAVKNWLYYSQAPDTAPWADEATPTSVNNNVAGLTAPDGTETVGTIVADAGGDGIKQTTTDGEALAAVSNAGTFSLWVKVDSGTLAGTLTISGEGATPETTTAAFTATTSWQRVKVYKSFSAAATGNMAVKCTCDAAGTLQIWGMQLVQVDSATVGSYHSGFQCYVPTTNATATSAFDQLSWAAENVDETFRTYGTFMVWHCPEHNSVDANTWTGKLFFDTAGTNDLAFSYGADTTNDKVGFYYNGTSAMYETITGHILTRGTWAHLACTWSNDSGTVTCYAYKNGAQIATKATGGVTTPPSAALVLGGRGDNAQLLRAEGSYSRMKLYTGVLNSIEIAAIYTAEKSLYGL